MTPSAQRSILLTPAGAGAIAVVRVTGPDAIGLVNRVFHSKNGQPLSENSAGRLRYGHFVDGEEVVDDVIVSLVQRDGGTKGRRDEGDEWTVDISCHGGVRVVERILQTLERLGAPACEPFAALDDVWPVRNLIEHEALEALCLAKTQRAVRFLTWQRDNLVPAIEALARFAETDAARAVGLLDALTARFPTARLVLHGATVALVGPPNSGKSTLFNRLLGRPAAVVSPAAGTTRDWVAEPIELDGFLITLVDTAGIHEAHDPLEQLAIDASQRAARQADIHVLVLDGTHPDRVPPAAAEPHAGRKVITLVNKADLGVSAPHGLQISAKTGQGIDLLLARLRETLGVVDWADDAPALFTQRQVRDAHDLRAALGANRASVPRCLEKLIGGVAS